MNSDGQMRNGVGASTMTATAMLILVYRQITWGSCQKADYDSVDLA